MQSYSVAVDAPFSQRLTYLGPEGAEDFFILQRGQRVKVPLGKANRLVDAVILGREQYTGEASLKNIAELDAEMPILPEAYLQWAEWLARYYFYPIGQVLKNFFPPLKKTGRGQRKKSPLPNSSKISPHPLNPIQSEIVERIQSHNGFATHLLHGVTGSGKTEVYLEEFERVVEQGGQALFLLPEISLTPQLLRRFTERFGDRLAVIHSQLTEREKTNQWWSMVEAKKQILLGARSALFCPLPKLSLIVVDEEHEGSYKQEEKLKYNARDAAIYLAKLHDIPIVLGSATPSLESYHNACSAKFFLHRMPDRVSARPLPEIRVVDLRQENAERKQSSEVDDLPAWMSRELDFELRNRLERGEQAALFLNRRGISQNLVCNHCGATKECPNCAISLSLHAKSHLLCHYCDYHEQKKDICEVCGQGEMQALGLGTERIEEDLKKLYPRARLARADRDEIQSREDMEDLIEGLEREEIDILIGTQMIAKGLDFPKLSLVALVLADIGFNLPDFRSAERSFQLITQVSGRAGRHEIPGLVLLQTYNPEHSSIQFAIKNDFEGFAEQELAERRELGYPPFGRLASLRLQGLDLYKVEAAAKELAARARYLQDKFPAFADLRVLGPSPAPLFKLRSKFRYHLMLKSPQAGPLQNFCVALTNKTDWLPAGVQLLIDIDPIQML